MMTTPPIAVRLVGDSLEEADLALRYAQWLERIADMHQDAHALANSVPAFAAPRTALDAARVGLLTSAGAYVEGDEAFDVADPHGDPSFRVIPDDVDLSAIRFAHSHYDTSRAEQDPNVVLPLSPLHELVATGEVGASAPRHIAMMGFNPDPRRLVAESVPKIVDLLRGDDVDIVVLSPG